ncbi:LysR substrate-binding domain-containing protein [Chelativorans salis]|uniref:LysR substrate-binding domain-containing protein n=1 Tax=Chelativorans salis TaxID=2978478 RepID=A0ABT2LQW0_9HYPH|nr:LysR substrate-binding domain-containing protein [Chelativorans sp. EGI FJ00035]MCT7376824.1 LysR substrate-binding domain-containing protein [Chelativorans sp. EGI FJ00035]
MFDTELLRSFVAVAESGGFTRAAERLHLTQSAVSAQIRRLEEQAGCPLLTRSTRSVALTEKGETLLSYARTILHLNEDAHARLTGSKLTGTIRIGTSEDFASTCLPHILRRFRASHPGVLLEVEVGIPPVLLQALDQERLDLVLGSRCRGEARGWRLWQEPLVWAFSEHDSLPCDRELPLAFFPEPCPYREAAIESMALNNQPWQIAYVSPSVAGVRAAALAGLAITPLPRSALGSGLRELGREDGLPDLPDVEFLVCTRDENRTKPSRTLVEMIRDATARRPVS